MRGLVATRNIKDGAHITKFAVDSVHLDRHAASEGDKYFVLKAAKGRFLRLSKIDLRTVKTDNENIGNLCNFANASSANARLSIFYRHNCVPQASLKACRNILKGADILTDYGDEEWTKSFRRNMRQKVSAHPNLLQGNRSYVKRKKVKKSNMLQLAGLRKGIHAGPTELKQLEETTVATVN